MDITTEDVDIITGDVDITTERCGYSEDKPCPKPAFRQAINKGKVP